MHRFFSRRSDAVAYAAKINARRRGPTAIYRTPAAWEQVRP